MRLKNQWHFKISMVMLVRYCNKVQAILKFWTKCLMVGIIFKWKVWFNMGCAYELGTAAVTQVLICCKYPRPPSHSQGVHSTMWQPPLWVGPTLKAHPDIDAQHWWPLISFRLCTNDCSIAHLGKKACERKSLRDCSYSGFRLTGIIYSLALMTSRREEPRWEPWQSD